MRRRLTCAGRERDGKERKRKMRVSHMVYIVAAKEKLQYVRK